MVRQVNLSDQNLISHASYYVVDLPRSVLYAKTIAYYHPIAAKIPSISPKKHVII